MRAPVRTPFDYKPVRANARALLCQDYGAIYRYFGLTRYAMSVPSAMEVPVHGASDSWLWPASCGLDLLRRFQTHSGLAGAARDLRGIRMPREGDLWKNPAHADPEYLLRGMRMPSESCLWKTQKIQFRNAAPAVHKSPRPAPTVQFRLIIGRVCVAGN